MWHICKLEHYSAIKEKEIMKISGESMDLERILSEIPKCREKNYMLSFLCGCQIIVCVRGVGVYRA